MQHEPHNSMRRRAVAVVQFAVLLPVVIGFAALAVDVGTLYDTKAELQRAADSAALAAIGVIAEGESTLAATQTAVDYVASNAVMGRLLTLESGSDVVFGRAHFDIASNSYNFVPGETPTNAVRTVLRHTDDSPNGAVPLYFAWIFGSAATNVTTQAMAIYVNTNYTEAECSDTVPANSTMLCHNEGDSDDSDDSASGASDDSDDSDTGDSDGSHNGDPDDSDDSESGASDDSDDSNDTDDSGGRDSGDTESAMDPADSDSPHTIIADSGAVGILLDGGDTLGPCHCRPGDPDDSDDSASGDSADSDDSVHDPADSDSDGGKDKKGDQDDSDDSDAHGNDSDDSGPGDPDDSDDSQGDPVFDSDDSDAGGDNDGSDMGGDNDQSWKIFLIE